MLFHRLLLSSAALVAGVFALASLQPAAAQSSALQPSPTTSTSAVDGLNGKFEALGGSYAKDGLAGAGGSLSLPVMGQFGAQFDGAAGSFGGHTLGDVGGHLFWRNPQQALVGLYVNETMWDRYGGVHVTRAGAEAEGYFGRFTLSGIAGVETGNDKTKLVATVNGGITTSTPTLTDTTRFFDHVDFAYYPLDNWKASIGQVYAGGKSGLALETEYGMPVSGGIMAAFFIQGRDGDGPRNYGVLTGVRFYFGQHDKTLMARHREDDPAFNWTPDSLLGISQSLGNTTTSGCPAGEVLFEGACEGI